MSFLLEIGAYFLGQKLADITWNGNELIEANLALRKEQLTHAQMQNEITRLKMELTLKEIANLTDAEWEAEFKRLENLT